MSYYKRHNYLNWMQFNMKSKKSLLIVMIGYIFNLGLYRILHMYGRKPYFEYFEKSAIIVFGITIFSNTFINSIKYNKKHNFSLCNYFYLVLCFYFDITLCVKLVLYMGSI